MRVRATAQGYANHRIYNIDDEFRIESKALFSENWMESLEPDAKAKGPQKTKAAKEDKAQADFEKAIDGAGDVI